MGIRSARGLVARAAFAPVLVFAIIACEDALSPPDDLGPSYSNTVVNLIRAPVSGSAINTCTDERVRFDGTVNILELHVMGGGAAAFCLEKSSFNNLSGTGEDSGDTYRVVKFLRREITQPPVTTEVEIDRLQFVNTDGGGIFFADATLTILIVQGEATLSLEVTDIEECIGGRN
jgi:hypothetical protein